MFLMRKKTDLSLESVFPRVVAGRAELVSW